MDCSSIRAFFSGYCSSSNAQNSSSKKLYCALLIIIGLGGLAAAGLGIGGYLHVGSLRHLSQLHSIILISAGGGAAVLSLALGIIGSVKKRAQTVGHNVPQSITSVPKPRPQPIENIYNAKAWETLGVTIVEAIPLVPEAFDLETLEKGADPFKEELLMKKNFILVYIPQSIRFQRKQATFTFELFQKILHEKKIELDLNWVKKELSQTPLRSGWMLIRKAPVMVGEGYDESKRCMEEKGFQVPKAWEALVALSIFYCNNPTHDMSKYTFCEETSTSGESRCVITYSQNDSKIITNGMGLDCTNHRLGICPIKWLS